MVGPVRLVEVDIVGLEPRQAVVDRLKDILAVERGHAAAARRLEPDMARPRYLRREADRVARLGLHPAPDDLLGAATPFALGRPRTPPPGPLTTYPPPPPPP